MNISCLFFLAVVTAMADGRKRAWDPKKRSSRAAGSADSEGIELAVHDKLAEDRRLLLLPMRSEDVYNMRVKGEKERLARDLWEGDFTASMLQLREQNVEFVDVLRAKFANLSDATPINHAAAQRHVVPSGSRDPWRPFGSFPSTKHMEMGTWAVESHSNMHLYHHICWPTHCFSSSNGDNSRNSFSVETYL